MKTCAIRSFFPEFFNFARLFSIFPHGFRRKRRSVSISGAPADATGESRLKRNSAQNLPRPAFGQMSRFLFFHIFAPGLENALKRV